MEVKVSIIVPVYNGEKYLINCLSFLVNQTLQDIQIIIIDDASTDGSRYIIEECSRQYPDKVISIFLDRNRGAGGARNIGLQRATGKYIGFVDCDDYVNVNMYEELFVAAIKENYDIVDSFLYHEKERNIVITTPTDVEGILDENKKKVLLMNTGYIVTKIFKASLLQEKEIKFRENVRYEDPDFLCRVYLEAKSIICIKKVFYFYRYNENSTTKAIDIKQYIFQEVQYMESLYKVFQMADKEAKYREELDYKLIYLYGKIMEGYIINDYNLEINELEMLRQAALSYIRNMDNQAVKGILDKNIYKLLFINNENPFKVKGIRDQL